MVKSRTAFFVRTLLAVCVAVAFSYAGTAEAQLSKDDTKCINAMNKDYGKLASSIGKDIAACVKFKGKNKVEKLGPGGTAKSCTTADVKGKVAKASSKVDADYGKKCPTDPSFGFTDTDTLKDAAWEAAINMVGDIFGADLLIDPNTVLTAHSRPVQGWDLDATLVETKAEAGCQDAVIKAVFKCQDAIAKAYGKCTKDTIKPLPSDPSSMAACFSGLLGKASKSCNKIGDAISKKCGGVDLKAAFPGCKGSSDLATCLTQSVDCRTCYALRKVDGLDAVCEGCLPVDPLPAAWECVYDPHAFCVGGDKHLEPCLDVAFFEQICWPAGQGMCVGNTSGFFTTASSPPSGGADIAVAATVSVLFGPVDPNTGIASARFSLTGPSDPISLGPIGDVCLFPAPDEICDEPGFIDCDGGTPLDKDEQMFHNIGLCGIADIGHDPNDTDPNNYTGGPECLALCEAKCDALTADPNYPYVYKRIPTRSQCEGYCIGGHKHDLPCTFDVDCAFDTDPITPGIQWDLTGLSGMCQGGDPVAHAHSCTCLCRGIGGAPGRPGAYHSEQAVYSNVEQNAPCDGVDITMFSPTCNAHATERFQTTIINVDMSGSDLVFPPERGNPAMCQQLIDRNVELMFFRAHTTTTDDANSGDNSALSRAACFKHSAGNYYDPSCSLPLGGHPDDYCDLLDPNGNPVDPNNP